MSEPFTLQATVSKDAIEKVTRLFNASLDDILAELFQNARRSGANRIEIDQFTHDELGPVIRVTDDGPGLAEPSSLFTLGSSSWSEETCSSEDAAGMGFFSLSGRRVRVIAQTKGTDASWILDADPDAFTGKKPIMGKAGPAGHKGVTILIASAKGENVVPAANHAAKYFPLPVTIEGVEAKYDDFLADAKHIVTWKGIRIGIFHNDVEVLSRGHTANFHGVTLPVPLPKLSQFHHEDYYARIDVLTCADLKLVLPARKEVVQDEFHQRLCDQVRRIYFELIAKAGKHSLSYRDYCLAQSKGFDLPEATPILRPFAPTYADHNSTEFKKPETIWEQAFLFEGEDEPVEEQNLAWALEDNSEGIRLYDPNSSFEGYHWYERLPRVEMTGYHVTGAGKTDIIPIGDAPAIKNRPEQISIIGHVIHGPDVATWSMETDIVLLAPPDAYVDETEFCMTASSTTTHDDLVDFLTRALFNPSDDAEAGSYDAQLQWFTDQAEDAAIAYLDTPDEVQMNQVVRAVKRELYWIIKAGSSIDIQIRDREVSVFGLQSAFKSSKEKESESLNGEG